MYQIDDYDLKMLTLLQTNGRLTNQELSELIGLSASQCSRRRIALEQAKQILGYHARLAPNAIGLDVSGFDRSAPDQPYPRLRGALSPNARRGGCDH